MVKRALVGYDYCLKEMQKQAHKQRIPSSFIRVPVMYWRSTVKTVLKVNDAELDLIENILIESHQLKYMDSSKLLLISPEQEQQQFMLDDDTGTSFNNWLDAPRDFIFC